MTLSARLNDNIEALRGLFGSSSDLCIRQVTAVWGGSAFYLALAYIDGLADTRAVQETVIPSLLDRSPDQAVPNELLLDAISTQVLGVGTVEKTDSVEAAAVKLLAGSLLLWVDGIAQCLTMPLPGWEDRPVSETKTQSVVRGPLESFTETLRVNTALIRRRIHDPRLWLQTMTVGSVTRTSVAVMYMHGIADQRCVDELLQRIRSIDIPSVLEGQYIEDFIRDKRSLFPTVYNTERPDTVAAGLLQGKIAIVVDGTPFVLLAPALFYDFIQAAEDFYHPFLYSSLLRLLRIVAILIATMAPSFYIALTTYQQEMIPTLLLLSLTSQREGIPFPSFIEALIMEITFEILREAGIRMPRTIGQAVSIVGTIVIGDAAVQADIVSAAMVIIVAITAISSFVLPAYNMSITFRMLRFVFMLLAASFGLYGMTAGIIALIVYLCGLNSLGVPYMSPIAPTKKGERINTILRAPYWDKGGGGQ